MERRRNNEGPTTDNQQQELENQPRITSDMIENAHAAGDGAIEKSDEDLFKTDEEDKDTKQVNY